MLQPAHGLERFALCVAAGIFLALWRVKLGIIPIIGAYAGLGMVWINAQRVF